MVTQRKSLAKILDASQPDAVPLAAETIRQGGLVAFPTETVYGLGADARNPIAVARVFEAKQRPAIDPLIVHVASPEEAGKLLWAAARGKEPWAIQELCRRFAPETHSLRLVHEVEDDGFDYPKLTDEQIIKIDAILGQASDQPDEAGDGESTTQLV